MSNQWRRIPWQGSAIGGCVLALGLALGAATTARANEFSAARPAASAPGAGTASNATTTSPSRSKERGTAGTPTSSKATSTAAGSTAAGSTAPRPTSRLNLPATALSDRRRVVHALNRLGYGPRPGEVDRVMQRGLEAWIEQQLHPERIADPEIDRRLAPYITLEMPPSQILMEMPPSALLRPMVDRLFKAGVSADQIQQLLPEAEGLIARAMAKDGAAGQRAAGATMRARKSGMGPEQRLRQRLTGPNRIIDEMWEAKLLRAVFSERQLQEVMTDFWFNHFNVYAAKGAAKWWLADYEHQAIRPHALGNFRDLLEATASHPAMLFYLDNWLSSREGAPKFGAAARPYANREIERLGWPAGGLPTAMLAQRGVDTQRIEAEVERRNKRAARKKRRSKRRKPGRDTSAIAPSEQRGLNENFARELLELHTLGVDGGYTQQDIVEVARCFTGWTLLPIHAGQDFVYIEELHDTGRKMVLGQPIESSGIAEGREVLDRLAAHPATARFISTKLARRFVADNPPPRLVEAMAATFLESSGDIRAVLRTLFEAPEFWAPDYERGKLKTPLELVASMARASRAQVSHNPVLLATAAEVGGPPADSAVIRAGRVAGFERPAPPLLPRAVRDLGQTLYFAIPPTGFGDVAEDWLSTDTLLKRMKLAMGLAGNKLRGVRVAPPPGFDPTIAISKRPAAASTAAAPQDGAVFGDERAANGEGRAAGGEERAATDDTAPAWLRSLGQDVLGAEPSTPWLTRIEAQLELPKDVLEELGVPRAAYRQPEVRWRLALGWMLATPEFQRR